MGIFSKIGNTIKTKLADDDFRDKLDGIGSILQGEDGVYQAYANRKRGRQADDYVSNAMTNGQAPVLDDPAYQSDLGQVRMPNMQGMAQRMYGRPNLPMLPNGQPTFLRRF